MIYLLGKGPSVSAWPADAGQTVYALNDAVYYTTPARQDVHFVRCDCCQFAFCVDIAPQVQIHLLEDLRRLNLYPNHDIHYFTHQQLGLPKRLCTVWMSVGLISKLDQPVHMYGFDHMAGKGYDYHPDLANHSNNIGHLANQLPSGKLIPRKMLKNFTIMPWNIPLEEAIYGKPEVVHVDIPFIPKPITPKRRPRGQWLRT